MNDQRNIVAVGCGCLMLAVSAWVGLWVVQLLIDIAKAVRS